MMDEAELVRLAKRAANAGLRSFDFEEIDAEDPLNSAISIALALELAGEGRLYPLSEPETDAERAAFAKKARWQPSLRVRPTQWATALAVVVVLAALLTWMRQRLGVDQHEMALLQRRIQDSRHDRQILTAEVKRRSRDLALLAESPYVRPTPDLKNIPVAAGLGGPTLNGPNLTSIATTDPILTWTAPQGDGAAKYEVTVYTPYKKILTTLPKSGTGVQVHLGAGSKGGLYGWSVTATFEGHEPPETAGARFKVLAEPDFARAGNILKDDTITPLAKAMLLARLGLLDDAERALERVSLPDRAAKQRLLSAIEAVRETNGG